MVGGNFIKRFISSVLLVPVVVLLTYFGSVPYILFVSLILIIVMIEYNGIVKRCKSMTYYIIWLCCGLCIALAAFFSLIYLRNSPNGGFNVLVWLFAIVWMTDTSAYLIGKLFGGPKIFPKISPNKTYSGCIGGLVVPLLVHVYLMFEFEYDATYIITFFISIFTMLGDFLESALKRKFNVKDSGFIIPGHGGILDRIDGLIPASIFLAVCFLLIE